MDFIIFILAIILTTLAYYHYHNISLIHNGLLNLDSKLKKISIIDYVPSESKCLSLNTYGENNLFYQKKNPSNKEQFGLELSSSFLFERIGMRLRQKNQRSNKFNFTKEIYILENCGERLQNSGITGINTIFTCVEKFENVQIKISENLKFEINEHNTPSSDENNIGEFSIQPIVWRESCNYKDFDIIERFTKSVNNRKPYIMTMVYLFALLSANILIENCCCNLMFLLSKSSKYLMNMLISLYFIYLLKEEKTRLVSIVKIFNNNSGNFCNNIGVHNILFDLFNLLNNIYNNNNYLFKLQLCSSIVIFSTYIFYFFSSRITQSDTSDRYSNSVNNRSNYNYYNKESSYSEENNNKSIIRTSISSISTTASIISNTFSNVNGFFTTRTGSKIHKNGCHHLRRSCNNASSEQINSREVCQACRFK